MKPNAPGKTPVPKDKVPFLKSIQPWHWFLFATIALIYFSTLSAASLGKQIPYSEFQKILKSGQVKSLAISQNTIQGERPGPDGKPEAFYTQRVDPGFAQELSQAGVEFREVPESGGLWTSPFVWLFAFMFVPLLIRSFLSPGQHDLSGALSFGRSRAKIHIVSATGISFKDVAGAGEAKAELQEVVQFLKTPDMYKKLGARIPKGILLIGPPGTGKTLIAKAVAGEAGVPFFSINGSEFVEMFVGVGAARVRDLFAQAREKSPCIIFIDELDALGRSRMAGGLGGGNDEKEQTLNQLLSELDGFDTRDGIVLLAATNRPEVLDPALLRAGRFDRQVLMDRPDRKERLEILRVHAAQVALSSVSDLDNVAAMTPGFTGADLANLVNEAALMATRRGADSVSHEDFSSALERIVAGLEKRNRLLNPVERKTVAFHEMGHALVAAALPTTDRVHKISIIPRGIGSLGYTIQRPTEDRFLMSQTELENKMAVLMGGRAAEELVFHEISTGASDDIARATDIARNMVTTYGMESRLGPVAFDAHEIRSQQSRASFLGEAKTASISEQTQMEIDSGVRALVNAALVRARRLLRVNRELLSEGAEKLLLSETLSELELNELFQRIVHPNWEHPVADRQFHESPVY